MACGHVTQQESLKKRDEKEINALAPTTTCATKFASGYIADVCFLHIRVEADSPSNVLAEHWQLSVSYQQVVTVFPLFVFVLSLLWNKSW